MSTLVGFPINSCVNCGGFFCPPEERVPIVKTVLCVLAHTDVRLQGQKRKRNKLKAKRWSVYCMFNKC